MNTKSVSQIIIRADHNEVGNNILSEVSQESVWLANFVSPDSKKTYSKAVREFIGFLNITSNEQLRSIDQAHIIAWRDNLIKKGSSPKTVQNRLSAISSLFNHLCNKQVAKINPVTGVKRPRVSTDQVKTQVITANQVRKMLEAPDLKTFKGCRDSAILHILFYAGCRVSEVAKLKVKNFYEDSGYFVLEFTVKGGKENRLAINQELQISIRRYLNLTGHSDKKEYPLILPVKAKEKYKHLSARQVNRIFQSYAALVKLPEGVTPHSARATFITQALERKCPIEAVQRSVGHSKIATTQMYDKRDTKFRESASLAVLY